MTYSQKDMSEPTATLLQQYRAVTPAGYPSMLAPTGADTAIIVGAL